MSWAALGKWLVKVLGNAAAEKLAGGLAEKATPKKKRR